MSETETNATTTSEATGASESKPAEGKPAEGKPTESEASESKASERKPAEREPPRDQTEPDAPEANAAQGPASDDSAQEVEPEVVESVKPKQKVFSHHPPPPPSLRPKSGGPSADASGTKPPEPRITVAGKPRFARDLMTRRLFTIGPNDTLEHLEEHMQSFRFRHLPVVDGDKVVGLITHRDLLHASSSFLSERAKERDAIIHKLPASRIMRNELVTARPETPLEEIAVLMWQKKIGCVLVTDEQGLLVGIETEADFIRLAHHFLVQQPPG